MHVEELSKLNVLVIGLAATGQAVVEKLLPYTRGLKVVEIKNSLQEQELAAKYKDKGVEVFLGEVDAALVSWADIVVPSPGVTPRNTLLQEAQKQKVPIISEIEIASWLAKAPVVAVTGTNGKTTTATLIYEILTEAGFRAVLAGNIGQPFIQVAKVSCDWFVVEVSSFQLAYTVTFKPKIAILLNMQPDHLDWHFDFTDYIQAKHKIYANQTKADFFIFNAQDRYCYPQNCQATVFPLGEEPFLYKTDSSLVVDVSLKQPLNVPLADVKLKGEHNYQNILAAAAATLLAGASPEAITKTIANFQGLAHRLEKVATTNGVTFYNDSKATNPAAAASAVETFSVPVILIAGGQNKGLKFTQLAKAAKGKVKLAVVYGEAKNELASAFKEQGINVSLAASFKQAVSLAKQAAGAGEVVLLAPACASFDAFADYKERGNLFKTLVLNSDTNYVKAKP